MNAVVSPCGLYRYAYSAGVAPFCAFVLLNPSTAGVEAPDDATTLRLRSFTKRWGFAGFELFNLGAGRATDPKDWLAMDDPYGPGNCLYLTLASAYETLVVGWGANAPREAVLQALPFLTMGRTDPLLCLGHNKDGSPKHPLYLRADTQLEPWKGLL